MAFTNWTAIPNRSGIVIGWHLRFGTNIFDSKQYPQLRVEAGQSLTICIEDDQFLSHPNGAIAELIEDDGKRYWFAFQKDQNHDG